MAEQCSETLSGGEQCTRESGHYGAHMSFDSAGVTAWGASSAGVVYSWTSIAPHGVGRTGQHENGE